MDSEYGGIKSREQFGLGWDYREKSDDDLEIWLIFLNNFVKILICAKSNMTFQVYRSK